MDRWLALFLEHGLADTADIVDEQQPKKSRISEALNGSAGSAGLTNGDDTTGLKHLQRSSTFEADLHSDNSIDADIGLAHTLYLDFESRHTGNSPLKRAGAWRYADDPHTEILTLVYQNGDAAPRLWVPSDGLSGSLVALAADPAISFVCFGDFELAVWECIMVARYGFPKIPISRWVNAQASCSYLALPRSLGKVLPVLGAPIVKDEAGRRLVLSLSRPIRKTGAYPDVTPEALERIHAYNKIDVEGLAAIHAATGKLPLRERQIWELDQQINQRGIQIDLEFVRAAKIIAEASKENLFDEFAGLTDGLTPYQVGATREWLKGRGFPITNLQDDTVSSALDELVLPDDVRRVLQLRLIAAPTSLTKLDAMLACAGSDGRARGLFQYHAATPGRWSAQLLQPQNLPRPIVDIAVNDIETLVAVIKSKDPAALLRWGQPIEVLASALRFALTAAEGAQFGVGDFAMIETCVLLALAGQHDKCKLIADGVDIYKDMAAAIYRLDRDAFMAIPKDALTLKQQQQRHTGKNTVLGCGYGMGGDTFYQRYCRHLGAEEGKQFATKVVYTDYRKSWAPKVSKLWKNLERTALRAMHCPGVITKAEPGITYQLDTKAGLPCLVCRLLNGKLLHYMNARVGESRFGYPTWSYWAYRRGQWREVEPFGGQLVENVVQALARELLVEAMFRFESRGFPVVMHCHDEIAVEHPGITKSLVKEIMTEPPQWAAELGAPISVEAWTGRRYRK
jgi:DNA polymerase